MTGSVNIKNKEHAVVILENIRPSAALSFLGFIDIDGVPAVDGEKLPGENVCAGGNHHALCQRPETFDCIFRTEFRWGNR